MRIGEVAAAAAGVNVETLRYYERRGLLGAPPRTAHGYRVYDLDTVRFVRSIKEAQGLGFSLTEIEEYLRLTGAGAPAEAMRARVGAKVAELDAKIESLERMRAGLGRLLYCTCASPDRCTCAGPHSSPAEGASRRPGGALHVTNGASAGNSLQHTDLEGTVLVWSDLFAEGPLAPVRPAAKLRALRARFWARQGHGRRGGAGRRDGAPRRGLRRGDGSRPPDRDLARARPARPAPARPHPGHDRRPRARLRQRRADRRRRRRGHPYFRGLGELQPDELEALWPRRVPLRPEAAELGARAWAAAAAPDPTALDALLQTDTKRLPLLAPALRRWLEELPDTAAGLALSERQHPRAAGRRPAHAPRALPRAHGARDGAVQRRRVVLRPDRRAGPARRARGGSGGDHRARPARAGRRARSRRRSPAWTAGSVGRN